LSTWRLLKAHFLCISDWLSAERSLLATRPLPKPVSARLQGVVDLVAMKGITWNGEELGASFDIGDIPESMKDQVGIRARVQVRVEGQAASFDTAMRP